MLKYLVAILFAPALTLVGLAIGSIGVANSNVTEEISNTTVLYVVYAFILAGCAIYLLTLTSTGEIHDRPGANMPVSVIYYVFIALVVLSILPLAVYGVPIVSGVNRYAFLEYPYVSELRQIDNAISLVFISALIFPRLNRNVLWAVLIALSFLYGEKFSPLFRVFYYELIIRLYLQEKILDRRFVVLVGALSGFVLAGASIYWWSGNLLDVLSNSAIRAGKQASCAIAVSNQPGFLVGEFGKFWNYFEVQAKGLSFFHEVSRAVSTRADQSVLGDSFPCVYMAMSPNVLIYSLAILVFTAVKVLLLKFLFLYIERIYVGLFSVLMLFLYVRYLDSMIMSDKFHLLTHPLFLAAAYFMVLVLVVQWHPKVTHD